MLCVRYRLAKPNPQNSTKAVVKLKEELAQIKQQLTVEQKRPIALEAQAYLEALRVIRKDYIRLYNKAFKLQLKYETLKLKK